MSSVYNAGITAQQPKGDSLKISNLQNEVKKLRSELNEAMRQISIFQVEINKMKNEFGQLRKKTKSEIQSMTGKINQVVKRV